MDEDTFPFYMGLLKNKTEMKEDTDKKIKMLIFHQWLAPYRIDQFNSLSQLFDLEVVYLFSNLTYDKFDQKKLQSQCMFKASYLLKGPQVKGRVFRFGILKKIKEFKPDIILSFEYSFTTQYITLLRELGIINQRIGTLVDDSIDICFNPRSKLRALARKKLLKHLDYLIILSSEVAQFYNKNFQLDESQIIISPILQLPERIRDNSTKLEQIADEYISNYNLRGKKVLLYVGRLSPEKALPSFLENISNLIEEDDSLVVVLVGDGNDKEKIKNTIKDNGLEDKVLLVGRYESHELHAWYLCSSGLVLPSISEPYGAVVNESLIFGKKVLCSNLAGASTLITNYNGVIFNPLNRQDTIEKTKEFLLKINPVIEVNIGISQSIMDSHPDDYLSEWAKISLV